MGRGFGKENVQSLKQFCEVVLELEAKEDDFGGDKEEEKGTKLFDNPLKDLDDKLAELLKNPEDNLSICGDCLDLIKSVTEARLSAKIVEESVEKLQMLLLRELRRLQGRLDMFGREFGKMEETLVNGDLKFMENKLDGNYSSDQHLERKREIFGFREKICGGN